MGWWRWPVAPPFPSSRPVAWRRWMTCGRWRNRVWPASSSARLCTRADSPSRRRSPRARPEDPEMYTSPRNSGWLCTSGDGGGCRMRNVRVIPCLDVDAGRVVKGVNFVDLRDAGDPVELAARYDAEGAD